MIQGISMSKNQIVLELSVTRLSIQYLPFLFLQFSETEATGNKNLLAKPLFTFTDE